MYYKYMGEDFMTVYLSEFEITSNSEQSKLSSKDKKLWQYKYRSSLAIPQRRLDISLNTFICRIDSMSS